jgi:hypothetical protein
VSDWIMIVVFCAVVTVVGWPWVEVLTGHRIGLIPQAGLAYLIGVAGVTLGELGVDYLGLPIVRPTMIGVFVVGFAIGFAARRRRTASQRPGEEPGSMLQAALPLALGALGLAFAVLLAFRLGRVQHPDFLDAWGIKGLSLFYHHNMLFADIVGPHRYYPPETSNLFGSAYLWLGHVDDRVIRVPLAMFGVSLAAAIWGLTRPVLSPWASATAVALAIGTPEFMIQMTNGQADAAVATYVTVAALAAFMWMLDGGSGYAALSGLAAGAAAWTKLEGALTCAAILLGVLIIRRSLRTPGLFAWVAWFLVFTVPWQVFQRIHHIGFNRRHFDTIYLNFPWIISHVSDALLRFERWGVFWPACLALIALSAPFWWRTHFRLLALLTLPNVVFTLGAWVTHYRAGIASSVAVTAPRLYMHIAPTVAVMAVAGTSVALAALLRRADEDTAAVDRG